MGHAYWRMDWILTPSGASFESTATLLIGENAVPQGFPTGLSTGLVDK
jgi:hypothetical protein